jgi:hypothetical protein
MAGDIWKTYDANSKGGSEFDDNDLNYLRGQNWSNNDIMKAAAKSGNVNANTSNALSKLSSSSMTYNDLPDKVKNTFGKGVYAMSGGTYTFVGGDAKDAKNYRMSRTADDNKGGQSVEGFALDFGRKATQASHNKKSEKNGGDEILQWGGINADGSANGLTGYKETFNGKDMKTPFKRENVSWALPSDMVENARQADFDKRYGAKQPAQSGGATDGSKKGSPKFDIRNFMTASKSSDSSVPSAFVADTKATAYEAYKTRRANEATTSSSSSSSSSGAAGSSYAPKTTAHPVASPADRDPNQRWRQFWDPNSKTAASGAKPILS